MRKRPNEDDGLDKVPDAEFGAFEKNTKGFGMKMLQKMGYKHGMGLGKHGEGIVNPVEVKLRGKNTGLGFEEEESISKEVKIGGKESAATVARGPRKPKDSEDSSWKAELDELQASLRTGSTGKVKILDYSQGAGPRELNSLGEIRRFTRQSPEHIPELRHNLAHLVSNLTRDMEKCCLERTRLESDSKMLMAEQKRLEIEVQALEDNRIQFNRLKALSKTALQDDFFLWTQSFFSALNQVTQEQYLSLYFSLFVTSASHYLSLNCSNLEQCFQLLKLKSWTPEALHLDGHTLITPYEHLSQISLFPVVKKMAMSEEIPSKIASMVDLLPDRLLQIVGETLLLPKCNRFIDDGDLDQAKLWLPTLQSFLAMPHNTFTAETLYSSIRRAVIKNLDRSGKMDAVHETLLQWKPPVIPTREFDTILIRSVIPRLESFLEALVIDPSDQQTEALDSIFLFLDMIPPKVIGDFFARIIGPKLLVTLINWLESPGADYGEISEWYMAWKSILPPAILEAPAVDDIFSQLLTEMTKYLD